MLEVKGLKGPRGKGSTRGRGGRRRSSLMSAVLEALEMVRMSLRSRELSALRLEARTQEGDSRWRAPDDVVRHSVKDLLC